MTVAEMKGLTADLGLCRNATRTSAEPLLSPLKRLQCLGVLLGMGIQYQSGLIFLRCLDLTVLLSRRACPAIRAPSNAMEHWHCPARCRDNGEGLSPLPRGSHSLIPAQFRGNNPDGDRRAPEARLSQRLPTFARHRCDPGNTRRFQNKRPIRSGFKSKTLRYS